MTKGLHIEVQHPGNRKSAQAIATTYDCDTGVLAMPEHIRIGQKTWDGDKIMSYSMQVDEYDIWLEDQIKIGNEQVLNAIDDIYNKALQGGIILITRCMPTPYITHAHVVKRTIDELAS